MAKLSLLTTKTLKATMYLLYLAITLGCANSARILDEVDTQPPILPNPSQLSNPATTTVPNVTPTVGPATTLPSGQIPATTTAPTTVVDDTDSPLPEPETPDANTTPVAPVPNVQVPNTIPTPVAGVAPVTSPTTTATAATSPTGPTPVTTATSATPGPQIPPLTFFMHDVLGGTHPSARVVTGIIANTQINGLPFSKANDNIFPVSGAVPLTNENLNGLLNNNNNLPFLAGLNGIGPQSSTTFQNSGNNAITNGGNSQPFVTAGQLPSGASLQKLMFGSLTVFDDELTEGQELGSAVLGKAQGFYLASSLDGTSQTIAVTVLLSHGGGGAGGQQHHDQTVIEDAISFFGVHRTASHESQIAVVGGTGKYENAKGYATLGSLHQENQHTTDGVDTILEFSVYLSY
ncbi:dirigent protein 24-like isoform X1 [Quercus lobata]|uniref:dirigent protein 24-like isoform X1 n=1 Tax=Quercus lobata TaxID=97700 RepID=UPI00124779C0|nr:dirigent protein 24-like isoform X1 [Quercus lobata]